MLTPREKFPLPENFPRGGSNPRRCGERAQTLPTSYSGPWTDLLRPFVPASSSRSSDGNSSLPDEGGSASQVPRASVQLASHGWFVPAATLR